MSIFIGALGRMQMVRYILDILRVCYGDILARYYRAKGENVLYVSGVIAMEHQLQFGQNKKV